MTMLLDFIATLALATKTRKSVMAKAKASFPGDQAATTRAVQDAHDEWSAARKRVRSIAPRAAAVIGLSTTALLAVACSI